MSCLWVCTFYALSDLRDNPYAQGQAAREQGDKRQPSVTAGQSLCLVHAAAPSSGKQPLEKGLRGSHSLEAPSTASLPGAPPGPHTHYQMGFHEDAGVHVSWLQPQKSCTVLKQQTCFSFMVLILTILLSEG